MCLLTGWRASAYRPFHFLRSAKMSSTATANGAKRAAAESEDATTKKLRVDGGGGAEVQPDSAKTTVEVPPAERWKLKKALLLVSYSGKGYLGMQRNPGCHTIEEELLQALHKAQAIPDHGLREQQSIWFQRAARTDKGVSAVKQCVSLKMAADTEGVLEAINAILPAQIRVFDMRRVTKRFDAKLQCSARSYQYMSPTFAFAPLEGVVSEQYRISEEVLKNVDRLFKKYEGTHNYHNYTSRRKPTDPSSKRFIMSVGCEQPFVREGIEFFVIKVKGQSFMLHQIRKMIGTVMAVARGHAAESVFERAWSLDRIDLPMAPALGLMLHEVHYDRYNQRFGSGGHNTHENIEWSGVEEKVAAFTEQFIHTDMVQTELQDKSMLTWLETLPLHTFDIREGDKSPLQAAKQQVEADTKAKSAEVTEADGGAAEVNADGGTVGGRTPSAGEAAPTDATRPAGPSVASDDGSAAGGVVGAQREPDATDAGVTTSEDAGGGEQNPSCDQAKASS